jgi:putative NADH-flavin reductase
LVEQGLNLGHEVTAFARIPAAVLIHHERLVVLQGDVLNPAKVEAAIADAEAVLSALGSGLSARKHVVSEGTRNIVAAMKKFGVRRFICETSYGTGSSYEDARLSAKLFFRTLLKNALADKDQQEEYIRNSGLDWVVVRPTGLTNGPRTGQYHAAERMRLGVGNRISRADVAEFMLGQLADDTWLHKFVVLSE